MNYLQASGIHTPKGYQKITSLGSAVGLTVPVGARAALMVPEGGAVRFRDDGVDPDATTGMPIAVNQPFEYSGKNLSAFRVIQQAAVATLHVYYYD